MNDENNSEKEEQRFPSYPRWIIGAFAILGLVILMYFVSPNNDPLAPQAVKTPVATLPQIVNAIAIGDVKTLTICGDVVIATKMDGSTLRARKESTLSALETLQLLGAPSQALTQLPLVVEEEITANSKLTNFIPNLIIVIVLIGITLVPLLLVRRSSRPTRAIARSLTMVP